MPVVTKLQSSSKPNAKPRAVLGPAGNRVRVSEDPNRNTETPKNQQQRPRKQASEIPETIVRNDVSVDSTCSSDSSASNSSARKVSSRRTVKRSGFKQVKIVPDGVDGAALSMKPTGPPKRCEWITPNSGMCIKLKFSVSNLIFFSYS